MQSATWTALGMTLLLACAPPVAFGPSGGDETGVVSNTRIGTLQDPDFSGWFRLRAN